jgi:DNA-binding CsgD family transcriptional regulator
MGAALERQPEYTDIVVVARLAGAPAFNTASIATLAKILPHLARSWRVRHALIDMQRTVGTLTQILDRFERAVVVAGPQGEIRFANAAADRLLTSGGAIDAKSGRLRATRHDQTKALHALIEAATRTAVGEDGAAVDAMGLSIEDQTAALSVVAEPLAPAHAEAIGHHANAGALLFIGDSTAATRPPPERLRVVYGMTEAEARVTSMIVAGHSLASLARKLGVSPNTAKFHLKHIFEKVGVTRQANLMRRILADVGGLAEPDLPGS